MLTTSIGCGAAAAQGRLDVAQARLLEQALGLAATEVDSAIAESGTPANEADRAFAMATDRFFDVGRADGPSEMPRGGNDGDRPFAHPVYWDAFVLTGL
jgi:CHAT domain-containing protein